ncbi:hypothetical protein IV203_001082 [Nitzschia inconspicua]|uniref:Uncharacterized protein n=1 Tax=Nitzschia inconspicua TaxID=303405 RepID=A0A9K3PR78_9STRA|nr:hypothetical protein IV203_001082 [Nitzschia inconspicua]
MVAQDTTHRRGLITGHDDYLPYHDTAAYKPPEDESYSTDTVLQSLARYVRSDNHDRPSNTSPRVLLGSSPPPRPINLYDLLDEDFIMCNTRMGYRYMNQTRSKVHTQEGRGRTTILDQIDGLGVKGGDDTFMTSRSYPRGIHIRHSSREQSVLGLASSPSCSDLVVSEKCFKYWQNEMEDIHNYRPGGKI